MNGGRQHCPRFSNHDLQNRVYQRSSCQQVFCASVPEESLSQEIQGDTAMNEKERIKRIGEWAKKNVKEYMLPFWSSEYILDRENGGYYGRITLDMQIDNERPRGLTFTGRQLFFMSYSYMYFGDPVYRERADWTFNEILDRFYDKEYGGAYSTVDKDKNVVLDNKSIYCMAFLVMGCAAYYHATKNQEALRIAMEAFDLIETKMKFGRCQYHSNMTRDWQVGEYMGGHGNKQNLNEAKRPDDAVTFPHHMYQAYLRLYQATHDEKVKAALYDMTWYYANVMYDSEYRCLRPTMSTSGERYNTVRQSFGHDCELSYLAVEIAETLGNDELTAKIKSEVADMLTRLRDECYDPYGALYDAGNYECEHTSKSHCWWAQAESVTAMFCGYYLTGDTRFLDRCEGQIKYLEKYFINRTHGDWYSDVIVDVNGWRLTEGSHGYDKLNAGKCPFHNGQMSFEVMRLTASQLMRP